MTQKKEITKNDIFELGQHIMKVDCSEFSVAVMELTALLNRKKDDSYYIQIMITSLAKDYVVDKMNMEYKYGINNQQVKKNNYLTFKMLVLL